MALAQVLRSLLCRSRRDMSPASRSRKTGDQRAALFTRGIPHRLHAAYLPPFKERTLLTEKHVRQRISSLDSSLQT